MKKLYTLVVMLMVATAASAQLWIQGQRNTQDMERNWFAGVHAGTNFVVGDNSTDHPPFKYLSDALGLEGGVYVGKFFTPSIGARLDFSYGKSYNRVDKEMVRNNEGFKSSFGNNGYCGFNVFHARVDGLFDFTGGSVNHRTDPFHVIGVVGLGLYSTSDYKLKEKDGHVLTSDEALFGGNETYPMALASEGGNTGFYGMVGFILDYRINEKVSVNFETNCSMRGDKFDGIDFSDPNDYLFKMQLGATYYF